MNIALRTGVLLAGLIASPLSAQTLNARTGEDLERLSRLEKARSAGPQRPDILGTAAVPLGQAQMDRRWRRLREAEGNHPSLNAITRRLAGLDRRAQIERVQKSVNAAIIYRSDRDLWGVDDYWATPQQTLERRSGDCEDIAVTKLAALRQAGFAAEDLYLVVGRDRKRGEHAFLMVRHAGTFWVLDDEGEARPATEGLDTFTPMLSFAGDQTWVHGFRRTGTRTAAAD